MQRVASLAWFSTHEVRDTTVGSVLLLVIVLTMQRNLAHFRVSVVRLMLFEVYLYTIFFKKKRLLFVLLLM